MDAIKVGIREFRADLAEYIASSRPVAVTDHGQTVGYFIPTKRGGEADVAALRRAGETFDEALAAKGIAIEDVVAEFDALRKKAYARKKPSRRAHE